MRKRFIYKDKSITADNQVFTFAGLGVADLNVTLPEFINPPIVNILQVKADTIVNVIATTADDFTIVIGSAGVVPSVASPIIFSFEIISQDEEETEPVGAGLVSPDWVKERFPQWQTLCTRADGLKTPDEMLIIAIEEASIVFAGYFEITADDMTDEYRIHLLKIIKHVIWAFMHGDSEFKTPPQIEKDYKDTIELLRKGLIGTGNIVMTAKSRLFEANEWFHSENLTAEEAN